MEVSINGTRIGDGHPCYITAEIGQNHNGDTYLATRLCAIAAKAGANAVKFCKRDIPSELTREAYDRPYEGPHAFGPTYGKHREALELSIAEYKHLADRIHYNEWPLTWFATACDLKSLAELESINCPAYKIASRDITNLPLIEAAAATGKPVILSTGMVTDRRQLTAASFEIPRDQLIILLCTSHYPTSFANVCLPMMDEIGQWYHCLVGISDHTIGIALASAAVARGACMIEKHITECRAYPGTDHACSLEPEGLTKLVRDVRNIEAAMRGTGWPAADEATRTKLGRSLVTTRTVWAGETISDDDVTLKSPGDGVSYLERDTVLGHAAARDIPENTTIRVGDVV